MARVAVFTCKQVVDGLTDLAENIDSAEVTAGLFLAIAYVKGLAVHIGREAGL